jgi:hypothetical protein
VTIVDAAPAFARPAPPVAEPATIVDAPAPVAASAPPIAPAPIANQTQPLAAVTNADAILRQQPPAPPAPAAEPIDLTRTLASPPSSSAMRAAQRARGRARGDELIAELFESMHDLHFLHDAVDGGAFCLALALEKLGAEFGVVHLYDIDRREFVVVSTRGKGSAALLLARYSESEPLLHAAMRKRRAIVVADASHADAASVGRFAPLGVVRTVLVAPVMQAGRFLGVIEIVNALDGNPFTDDEGNALNYIAEQFAEFVATVGIVTDPDRINSAAAASSR